jgi:hypothetical protein
MQITINGFRKVVEVRKSKYYHWFYIRLRGRWYGVGFLFVWKRKHKESFFLFETYCHNESEPKEQLREKKRTKVIRLFQRME